MVVLAGPSGAGKSHLADRVGLPVLRLDDFYLPGDSPGLPWVDLPGGDPVVDWDDPASWDRAAAVSAVDALCHAGSCEVPLYDIAASARTGSRVVHLGGAGAFVAEGIFAHEVVEECRARGLLLEAYCVTQHPAVTFVRRLVRDLREHRKPPWVLVRRGVRLLREQRSVVARAALVGCRVVPPEVAHREIRAMAG